MEVIDDMIGWLARGIRNLCDGFNGRPTELLALGAPQFYPFSVAYRLVTFCRPL